jgi:hypothetical protein
LDKVDGPLIGEITIAANSQWKNFKSRMKNFVPGVHHLFVISVSGSPIEVDFIRFE